LFGKVAYVKKKSIFAIHRIFPPIISLTKTLVFMNKAELVDKLSKDASLTKVQANEALDSFTNSIVGALKKGDRVTLVGFGTFSVSERSARNGRNPQTGEVIKIKARKVPRFKAGKDFSTKIGGKK
jgi:DNA-binding protein HU-beta